MICLRCAAITDNEKYCEACLSEGGLVVKACRLCGEEKPLEDFPYKWNKHKEKVRLPLCRECTRKKAKENKQLTACQFTVDCRKYSYKVCLGDYLAGRKKASKETIAQILEFISGKLGKVYLYDNGRIQCNGITVAKGTPQEALLSWRGLRKAVEKEARGDYVKKLTKQDVRAIRWALTRKVKYKDLAKKYGVSIGLIGKIKRGER